MFHENLEKGPTYYVTKDFREDIKKLDFANFLENKLTTPMPILFRLVFIFLIFGIIFLLITQTLIISYDFILSLEMKKSDLYQFNFSDVSSTLVILYQLQPIFFIITTILVLVGLYGIMRRGVITPMTLNPDQQYLINNIRSISAEHPSLLNKFIKYIEAENKFRLIGFFSSFDPYRCYSGMIIMPFSTLTRVIIATIWIFTTGFVNMSILFLIEIPQTVQMEQMTYLGSMVTVIGFCFFFLYGSQMLRDFRGFYSFLNELIIRQEEYISLLIVKLNTQNAKEELILEKQLANEDYIHYKSLKNLPKKYILRASTALIPIGFSILSLILR